MVSTPVTVDAAGNAWFGFFVNAANSAGLDQRRRAHLREGRRHLAGGERARQRRHHRSRRDEQRAGAVGGRDDAVRGGEHCPGARLSAGARQRDAHAGGARGAASIRPAASLARIAGDATASPTIGPGRRCVLRRARIHASAANNGRGWLLHFNAALTQTKIPGAFGWDDTRVHRAGRRRADRTPGRRPIYWPPSTTTTPAPARATASIAWRCSIRRPPHIDPISGVTDHGRGA